jgi:geranylgeranyl diphosphate synthase type I
VNNPNLLAAMADVAKYWRDVSRPALTSFSCEAVGSNPEMASDAALMFTLASAGFGIHDDILDKSPNKHLRMTILGLHGIDSALLIGDLLIVKAWTIASEIIRKTSTPIRIADILNVYGNLSVEICEAEFMETSCRRKLEIDIDMYTNILWKAMAETEACSRIGAMLGDGKEKEVEALAGFGRRLGFMSRLADDIEDCLNLEGDLLHRIKYESLPLPILYTAKSSIENYVRVKQIIEKSSIAPSDVKLLLKLCFEAEAFEYVRKIAEKNGRDAIGKLFSLKPSNSRKVLHSMIKISLERINNLCF